MIKSFYKTLFGSRPLSLTDALYDAKMSSS
jgi:hypothetical protein